MKADRIVLMGVAGCGKTSVGLALAPLISAIYIDGDDLHPPANIAKMRRGEALTDSDRWPWLAAVGGALDGPGRLVGCSALRRTYRMRIAEHASGPVQFIHLSGSRALIATRMAARMGHFMPTSLLDSQFATLEPPAPDEGAITVNIDQPMERLLSEIIEGLQNRG